MARPRNARLENAIAFLNTQIDKREESKGVICHMCSDALITSKTLQQE
jgi:hypothetical protein